MSTKILIVDDEPNVRLNYRITLETEGYEVFEAPSSASALQQFLEHSFVVAVLDMRMPGMDGLELLAKMREVGITVPAMIVTAYSDVPHAVKAMKLGAIDFLTKPVGRGPLLAAIRAALARDAAQAATDERLADLRARFASLTPREREVLDGVVSGKLNKQIAHDIGVAERTVKAHRAHVMEKLGADSPAVLGRIVGQLGELPKPADPDRPS